MRSIKAILIKTVSYTDFNGQSRTIKAGQSIQVVEVATPLVSTSAKGIRTTELIGSFIGTAGSDSFDLDRNEFKTVD